MGKPFGEIDADLQAFIEAQRMFFVATAPLDGAGHVNVSPKGLDTLRVLTPGRWRTWTTWAAAPKRSPI